MNPDDAHAHYNLGDTYKALKRYGEAIPSYKEAIRIIPDDAYSHYNLGISYIHLRY